MGKKMKSIVLSVGECAHGGNSIVLQGHCQGVVRKGMVYHRQKIHALRLRL